MKNLEHLDSPTAAGIATAPGSSMLHVVNFRWWRFVNDVRNVRFHDNVLATVVTSNDSGRPLLSCFKAPSYISPHTQKKVGSSSPNNFKRVKLYRSDDCNGLSLVLQSITFKPRLN